MPYILPNNRTKFKLHIEQALHVLVDDSDALLIKGEFFAYFAARVIARFMADPGYQRNCFNAHIFNEAKKKDLAEAADSIAALLNRADPIAAAGELNYAITAVLWGFMGQCKGFALHGYGVRAYIEGLLENIRQADFLSLQPNHESQRDAIMYTRRMSVVKGVLNHISAETYRRSTADYEDAKLVQHGDVWALGELTGKEVTK